MMVSDTPSTAGRAAGPDQQRRRRHRPDQAETGAENARQQVAGQEHRTGDVAGVVRERRGRVGLVGERAQHEQHGVQRQQPQSGPHGPTDRPRIRPRIDAHTVPAAVAWQSGRVSAPLIVTALLDPASQQRFDQLRRQHFPPAVGCYPFDDRTAGQPA
jgi:hypothetical protein